MTLVPRVVELLKDKQAEDVVVILGGTIPADDIPELKRLGVAEIFTPAPHPGHRGVRPGRRDQFVTLRRVPFVARD